MKNNVKKVVSVLTAASMTVSLASVAGAESAEYIAAPYTVEDGIECPMEYMAPVFYENEDGPTIGVITTRSWMCLRTGGYLQKSVWQIWLEK